MTPEEAADKIIGDDRWCHSEFGMASHIDFWTLNELIVAAINQAVAAEREACAQLADEYAASGDEDDNDTLTILDCRMHVEGLAADIRKRGAV